MGGRSLGLTTQTAGGTTSVLGKARVQQLVLVYAPEKTSLPPLALTSSPVAIGRVAGNALTLVVPDAEVSRTHAVVERRDDGSWEIVDNGSRNGTLVDGVRAPRSALRDGSVIRVGRSLLVFVEIELAPDAALEREVPALRGESLRMQALRGEIALVAPHATPVLVLGESGAGKERVAEEIHRLSGRAGAFVAVNCAAIPEALAESELFGHAAGAFTGATGKSDGVFVAADRGTLFLDEIAELPGSLQSKLLRAVGTGEIRAVGRSDTRKVDVRIVAATHRDVAAAVASSDFRGDLFARLSAWTLHVPPLRAHRDDLLRLAQTFLAAKGEALPVAANAAEALLLFNWPYNVRQLQNVVAAASVRAERAGTIRCEHLPDEIARAVSGREEPRTKPSVAPPPLEAFVPRDATPTAEQLTAVIERMDGNMKRVADYFGKDRKQIYRWAERYGIQRRDGEE